MFYDFVDWGGKSKRFCFEFLIDDRCSLLCIIHEILPGTSLILEIFYRSSRKKGETRGWGESRVVAHSWIDQHLYTGFIQILKCICVICQIVCLVCLPYVMVTRLQVIGRDLKKSRMVLRLVQVYEVLMIWLLSFEWNVENARPWMCERLRSVQ